MARNNNLHDFLTDIADAIREKHKDNNPINPQDFSSKIRNISSGGSNSSDDILYYKVVKDESIMMHDLSAWDFALEFMYAYGFVTHLIEIKTPESSVSGLFSYTRSQVLNKSLPINNVFSPTLNEESLNVLGFAVYKGETTNWMSDSTTYTSKEGTLLEKVLEFLETTEQIDEEHREIVTKAINGCFIPISKEEYAALA